MPARDATDGNNFTQDADATPLVRVHAHAAVSCDAVVNLVKFDSAGMANYYEAMEVDNVPEYSEDKESASQDGEPGAQSMLGVEDLDFSEMNMQLRLSCTPVASPAPPTKHFTGSAKKSLLESGDSDSLNLTVANIEDVTAAETKWSMGDHNANNSSEEDSTSSKTTSQSEDRNKTMLQSVNSKISIDCINNNDARTFDKSYNGENISNTSPFADATVSTLNKDKPTSPIMRGLKSVINMFRPSQSPIAPSDSHNLTEDRTQNQESPTTTVTHEIPSSESVLVSTPVHSDSDSKRLSEQQSLKGISPHTGDSIVFNEDIINDLHWNDDSTIIFNRNKMPCRKLYTSSTSSSDSRYSVRSVKISRDEAEAKEVVSSNKAFDKTVEHVDMIHLNSKCSPRMCQIRPEDDADENETKLECIQGIVDNVLDSVFETAEIFVNESYALQTLKVDTKSALDTMFSLDETNENISVKENKIYVSNGADQKQSNRGEMIELSHVVKDIEGNEQDAIQYSEESTPENKSKILTSETKESVLTCEIRENNVDSVTIVTPIANDNKYNESENNDTHSKISVNYMDNNKIMDIEKVLRSVQNSSCISLNTPHEENINELPSVANDLDFNFDAVDNSFLSRSRVTMSPPRNTVSDESIKHSVGQQQIINSENIVRMRPSSSDITLEYNTDPHLTKAGDFQANNITSKYNGKLSNAELPHLTIDRVEYEEQLSPKENDDFNIALELISNATPIGMEIVQSIESYEQSDSYLSADSGRESEHMLDSELDLIDNNTETHVFESVQEIDTHHLINKTGYVSLNENKKHSNVKTSVTECENPFTAKTDFCVLPNLTHINSIKIVKSAPVADLENLLTTKSTSILPPIPHNGPTCIETAESPFATKSKLPMSPSLIREDNTSIPKTKHDISNQKISVRGENDNMKENMKIERYTKVLQSGTYNAALNSLDNSNSVLVTSPPSVQVQPRVMANAKIKYEFKSDILKLTEINYDSIENPFAKKIRISESPVRSNFDDSENPFTTKSMDAISPPKSPKFKLTLDKMSAVVDPLATKNNIQITPPPLYPKLLEHRNEEMSLKTVSVNEDTATHPPVLLEITYDIKNCVKDSECDLADLSGSSHSFSGINATVKGVKSEDEDTLEGPDFVDLEVKIENPFDTKCNRILSVINEKINEDNKNCKIIQCSDLVSKKTLVDDLPSEEEFMECIDAEFKPREMFINADAFEFLMSQHSIANRDNGKESLFLKFDPLCAQRSLVGAIPNDDSRNISNVFCRPEIIEESPGLSSVAATLPKPDKTSTQTVSCIDNLNTTKDASNSQPHNNNSTPPPPEKPMMAVMPAVNNEPTINARSSPYTPTRSERRSMTFASPAIAAIDRLITLSGNNSPVNQTYFVDNTAMTQDTRQAMVQVQELLAQKDIEVHQLKQENRDLQDKLTELEIQMRSTQEDNVERITRIDDLKSKLSHKTVLNNNMSAAVEQYERAIASMIAENEQEKEKHERERAGLIRERDEQVAHLSSMEISFSDLHTKYERTKQLILTFKSNEESLRRTIEDYKASQQTFQNNYEALKQQAISKINNANIEMDKLKRSHEAEVVKLTAQIKRKELHATSLEESLAQKIKANEELTAICDELISKVG